MSKYIDKDKVLEYIIFGVVGKDITCGELARAIESLPTIEVSERHEKWIPCSEGLPNDDESVIVSVLDNRGDVPWKYTTVAWRCSGVWISDNDILCGTVVAWMPLPEPYREESEVEE